MSIPKEEKIAVGVKEQLREHVREKVREHVREHALLKAGPYSGYGLQPPKTTVFTPNYI